LLGALHGVSAIPPAWLAHLAERDAIEREAIQLAVLVTTSSP
jgi:ADP-ribosylglycohydrolase